VWRKLRPGDLRIRDVFLWILPLFAAFLLLEDGVDALQHRLTASWVRVPCTVTSFEVEHRNRGLRLTAEYTYEWQGRRFTSDNVLFGRDRLRYGHWQVPGRAAEITHCFVDPARPTDAVLLRVPPNPQWGWIAVPAALGGIAWGIWLIAASVKWLLRPRSREGDVAEDSRPKTRHGRR
jgi:hypothetical protein